MCAGFLIRRHAKLIFQLTPLRLFSRSDFISPRSRATIAEINPSCASQVRPVKIHPAATAAPAMKIREGTLAAAASPASPVVSASLSWGCDSASKIRAETTAFAWRSPTASIDASVKPAGLGRIARRISTNAPRARAKTAVSVWTESIITPAYATELGTCFREIKVEILIDL